jgi:hypothetical protein
MDFEVIGDITGIETIATGSGIRDHSVYVNAMVVDGGASVRVSRKSASYPAKSYGPSYTGMKLLVSESAK